MRVEAVSRLRAVESVVAAAREHPTRPVLVRAPAGAGGGLVVHAAARLLPEESPLVAAALEVLDGDELLALRGAHGNRRVLMACTDEVLPTAAQRVVDYLRPVVVVLPALNLDETVAVVDELWQRPCGDEAAARIVGSTDGRLGDVIEVATFLAGPDPADADPDDRAPDAFVLVGFPATTDRLAGVLAETSTHAWAVVERAHLSCRERLVSAPPSARPIDAEVVAQTLTGEERRAALRLLCDVAATVPAEELTAGDRVAIASWWCELAEPGSALGHQELIALFAGVTDAFALNRWPEALQMADRLWSTTHVAMAGVALAAALCRHAPDERLRELEAHSDDKVRGVAAFTRASWQFFVDHDPVAARATLESVLATSAAEHGLLIDGLAMLDAYGGAPDAVDQRLLSRPTSAEPTTPFALSVLVMADLVRSRHAAVVQRLDAELGRLDAPGMNLTAERYRFFRSFAIAQAGSSAVDLEPEFAELYERGLHLGDDWGLGWTAWGAGVHAARAGRFRTAARRLTTAVAAFERAGRPGFAMWPATALAQVQALVGDEPECARLAEGLHAVVADRADAQLALAMALRAAGRPRSEVAAALHLAAHTARAQREVVSSYRIALEQLDAGVDVDEPIADEAADGALVANWASASSTDAERVEAAALQLVAAGWQVLGVRVLTRAMVLARRDDLRRATRLGQSIRLLQAEFERPLAAWVVPPLGLPMLSARELEIAEAIAAGAGRDELAETLVVSRRTVDSHLQRIYTKLGVSSRAELREWLATRR